MVQTSDNYSYPLACISSITNYSQPFPMNIAITLKHLSCVTGSLILQTVESQWYGLWCQAAKMLGHHPLYFYQYPNSRNTQ